MSGGAIAAAKARAAKKAQDRIRDARKATMEPGPPAPPITEKVTR